MKRVPIPFREITVQPLDAGCETKEQTLHLPAQTEIYVCVCVMVDLYARIMTMSNFIGQVVVGFYEKFCFSILSPMIACAHVVNTRPSVHHSSFRRTFRVDRGYHKDGLSLIDSSNSIWPKNNLFRFINEIMDRMEQHEFV